MRLLLLTLAALALLPQVIPAYGGKKCWQKTGHCRKYCKANEEIKTACRNHRVCCVPGNKGHKPISPGKEVPRTFSTQASHVHASPVDFIITIPSMSSDLEVYITEIENEQLLEAEMSPPPVHQSS